MVSYTPVKLFGDDAFVGKPGAQSDAARQTLQHVLATGKASATIHTILGTNYAAAGDRERALLHSPRAPSGFFMRV